MHYYREHGLGGLPAPIVLAETGSTNDEAEALARRGCPDWTVVVADEQTHGRGRLDRQWVSPPGRGLLCSIVARPGATWIAPALGGFWNWVPLLTGLAVRDALRAHGAEVGLKWPNDVLSSGGHKLAGLLCVKAESAAVLGIGVNVSTRPEELPIEQATSLAILGIEVSREELLARIVARLVQIWGQLDAVAGDVARSGLPELYRSSCTTLGRSVEVHPALNGAGELVVDTAQGIDPDGHLVLASGRVVSAGDVIHLTHG